MRIAEFHIEGFGCLSDLSLTDVPPGLSVVCGDNEAGKTTLLAFLRSILFGFPSRKQNDYYPPLHGGRKGGRIVLLDDKSQRTIVERFEGRAIGPLTVTFPNGAQGGEEEFRQLIGSATADLYRNVFAFSLSELQTIDSLATDKVRDAIYSAGIGIGRRTITDVVNELRSRSGNLFAPGGSKPAMNKTLGKIEDLRRQINDRENDFDEYQRVQAEFEATEVGIDRICNDLAGLRRRFERIKTLQQAWNDWIALGDCREQLKSLPTIVSFPDNGVQRMDTLCAERRSLNDQKTGNIAEKADDEKRLSGIEVEQALLLAGDDVRQMERGLELFERSLQQRPSLQMERELAEQRLDGMLCDLGEEWDEGKLAEFDLSIPAREEIDRCRRALEKATQGVHVARLQWDQEKELLKDASEAEVAATSSLERLPKPSETLDSGGIQKLVLGRQSYENARRDLPAIHTQCETRLGHLVDTLRNIGPGWTEERLLECDTSLAVQEEVSAHQRLLSEFQAQQREAAHRLDEAVRSRDDAQTDLERAEEALSTMPASETNDEAAILERRRLLRDLRLQLGEAEQHRARLAFLAERKQDFDEQAARLQRDLARESFRVPGWAVPAALALGLAGLLGLGIARSDWLSGGVLFVLSAVIAVLLFFGLRKAAAAAENRRADGTREIADLGGRSAALEREANEHRRSVEHLDQELRKQVQAVGFGAMLALSEAEGLVERALEALRQRQPAIQRHADGKASLAKAQQAIAPATDFEAGEAVQLRTAQKEWRRWLAHAGLPETLTPESAAKVLAGLDAAREQLKAIEGDRERLRQMMGAMREYGQQAMLAATASGLEDLTWDEAGTVVDMLEARLKAHEEAVRATNEAARRLEEAGTQTARARDRARAAEQRHGGAMDMELQSTQRWTALLARLGLRSSLAVENAPQMLHAVEAARTQLGAVNALQKRQQNLQESVDSFCRQAQSVAKAAGRIGFADEDASKSVSCLVVELNRAEENKRQVEILQGKIKESIARFDRCQLQIDQRQREVDELLAAAGAADEEAFRRRASDCDARQELMEQIRQHETHLRQLAGSGDAIVVLGDELSRTIPENLASERSELEEAIRKKEEEQTDAADKRGRLRHHLEQLENSDELARLRLEEHALVAEFQSHAEEWSVLRIAAHLVDQAREKYERERRPAVLKEAERYFSQFTKGNYAEIRTPAGADRIIVLAPNGTTRDADQLSRGTAEQLYLSLRFGFVREFVGRSEALPLVFDDILVNFDPARARATAEAISDLARSLQILFFTCHPATVKLIREVDSSVPVYALNDGQLAQVGADFP